MSRVLRLLDVVLVARLRLVNFSGLLRLVLAGTRLGRVYIVLCVLIFPVDCIVVYMPVVLCMCWGCSLRPSSDPSVRLVGFDVVCCCCITLSRVLEWGTSFVAARLIMLLI